MFRCDLRVSLAEQDDMHYMDTWQVVVLDNSSHISTNDEACDS